MSVRDYLRKREWSMGNGQCPDCCGVPPDWLGHPLHETPETIGHKLGCQLAEALADAGERVVYLGEYTPDPAWVTWDAMIEAARRASI